MRYNLATIEVVGLAPALVIADEVVKAAAVRIVGIEADGGNQSLIKLVGSAGDCTRAIEVARGIAESMHGKIATALRLMFEDTEQVRFVESPQEFSGITDGNTHVLPKDHGNKGVNMQAIGLLETQGLTGVIEGADAMLKAANVEIVGKEKIGGAHVTVFVRGDVAAVKAAIDAGKEAAARVGKVVAAHVIARPHEGLAKLLPP